MCRQFLRGVVLGVLFLLSPAVWAATHCVQDFAGLRAALDDFDAGNSTIIHLVQGTYAIDNSQGRVLGDFGGYTMDASIQIIGGYVPGCGSRVINPANTVIDGQNQPDSHLHLWGNGDHVLMGITFTRLTSTFMTVALRHGDADASGNTFTVKYCRFIGNSGSNAALFLDPAGSGGSSSARTIVWNNLIANGTGSGPSMVLNVVKNAVIDFTNNTVAFNSRSAVFEAATQDPPSNADSTLRIMDNIFWSNGTVDLDVSDVSSKGLTPSVAYNIVGTLAGTIQPTTSNSNLDPKFVSPGVDYRLQNASPAVNSGASYQPAGFPSQDITGGPRIVGSTIDRGAYESSFDDLNDFIVTNTGNTGPGSLRQAIIGANTNPGKSRILFQLSSCPAVINLTSALDAITTDVTIDGYTQSGATPNTSWSSFDANLCVVLNGAGSLANGLRTTGNGRVTVRGLIFTGFTDAAIRFDGGSGHYVSGNQIGEVPLTVQNKDGVRVSGSAGNAMIGGDYNDPAVVNLIGGNSGAAVSIDSSAGGVVVANNRIGVLADGSGGAGNTTGIAIFNSPGNTIQYNTITASASYGVTIGGSAATGNIVQDNTVGRDLGNACSANGSGGVLISFAAHDNTVGATANSTGGGNEIACNSGPGVWISTSGGSGNRILANRINGNTGQAIDLGTAGPTANDVGNFDADSGPNGLQNYPDTLGAYLTSNAFWIEGNLDSHFLLFGDNQFRIDLYEGLQCGTRGQAGPTYLGRANVTTTSDGHVHYWIKLVAKPLNQPLRYVSATATDSAGSTSEIGTCVLESTDMLFRDTFE